MLYFDTWTPIRVLWVKLCFAEIRETDHNGQERHAIHLRLVDVYAGDVQDGRAEVDVGHQHLSATADISTAACHSSQSSPKPATNTALYLAGLVGFDVRSSDHERNSDVKLVELPLVHRKRELTWRARRTCEEGQTPKPPGHPSTENLQPENHQKVLHQTVTRGCSTEETRQTRTFRRPFTTEPLE